MTAAALVFDFGGVITRTLFETHRQSERALGLAPGTLTWRGPFAPSTDPEWVAMQSGAMSEREYWMLRTREVGALVGEDWSRMSDLLRAARGARPMASIRPEALDAISTARYAGHRLAILSNELDLFYGSEFRAGLPFLADFDAIVDATYTGVLKPDPAAYHAVCLALGTAPDRCVFVDDQPRNIAGARAAGMHTVDFDVQRPADGFARALHKLSVLTKEV